MSTNDNDTLEDQKLRRRKIARMKTGIVMTIGIWMIVSFLAVIVLTVFVVKLNSKVYKLENKINSLSALSEDVVENNSSNKNDTKESIYKDVVREIDSEDNFYSEGDERKVYLTFDCVPGEHTITILNALAEKNVKATFFVTGDTTGQYDEIYRRIVNEGHTIGMCSYSNSFNELYDSEESFIADLDNISNHIENVTGVKPKYYRFLGGSMNEITNIDMVDFAKILKDRGITYYDWNVNSGDASTQCTVEDVVNNVKEGVTQYKNSVVFMHDVSYESTTADAISSLVDELISMDAEILPIDENTYVVQYIKADTIE